MAVLGGGTFGGAIKLPSVVYATLIRVSECFSHRIGLAGAVVAWLQVLFFLICLLVFPASRDSGRPTQDADF